MKRDLIYIEWYDHWAQGTWSKDDEDPEDLTVCSSVGWLHKEDEKTLVLIGSVCEETHQVGNLQCIGKGLIKTRKVLKKGSRGKSGKVVVTNETISTK